jgi:hypothetical protein
LRVRFANLLRSAPVAAVRGEGKTRLVKVRRAGSLLVATGVVLAGCLTTAANSAPTTARGSAGPGRVSTAGWILHTVDGGGVIVSVKTPRTWSHVLTPSMNGGGDVNATTYISDFALHRFCYHRRTVSGCDPGESGALPPDSGVLSVTEYSPSGATIPGPSDVQGGVATTIDGYPGTAHLPHDADCTSLADFVTYYYEVALWIPAGMQLSFCVNGPHLGRLEAILATIAASATFRPDPRSSSTPITMSGETTTEGGYRAGSNVPDCTSAEVTPGIAATVSQVHGRTYLDVTSRFTAATSLRCGLPPLSTCGFYGDFAVYGPRGTVLWTWEPTSLGRQCLRGVWLLPVTITVPKWSVPTKLLRAGYYTVRMVTIINGRIHGPVLASTDFPLS